MRRGPGRTASHQLASAERLPSGFVALGDCICPQLCSWSCTAAPVYPRWSCARRPASGSGVGSAGPQRGALPRGTAACHGMGTALLQDALDSSAPGSPGWSGWEVMTSHQLPTDPLCTPLQPGGDALLPACPFPHPAVGRGWGSEEQCWEAAGSHRLCRGSCSKVGGAIKSPWNRPQP